MEDLRYKRSEGIDSYRGAAGALREIVEFLGSTPKQREYLRKQHERDCKKEKYKRLRTKLENRVDSYENIKSAKSKLRRLSWNLWKRSFLAWIYSDVSGGDVFKESETGKVHNSFANQRDYLKRLINLKGHEDTTKLLYKRDILGIREPNPKYKYNDLLHEGDLDVTRDFIKKSLEEGEPLIYFHRFLPHRGSQEAKDFVKEIIGYAKENYGRCVSRALRDRAHISHFHKGILAKLLRFDPVNCYACKEWQEWKEDDKKSFEQEIESLRNKYSLIS